jgi:hypothetical protein
MPPTCSAAVFCFSAAVFCFSVFFAARLRFCWAAAASFCACDLALIGLAGGLELKQPSLSPSSIIVYETCIKDNINIFMHYF